VLRGKTAWITGAGSGIGRSGALALAEAGAFVIVSGRRAELIKAVADEIAAVGGKAEAIPLDVGESGAVAEAGAEILARHGHVDILVNSAGVNVANRHWKSLVVEDFDRIFATNLNGTLYCIAAVLPTMRRRKDGVIINVASWAGRFPSFYVGPAYNSSKAAVVALTHSLNDEEGPNGIRACALCPGEVATPILAKRPLPPPPEDVARMLQPEDLARAIRFVAEMPPHVVVNELVISPTWNRLLIGGKDLVRD
jgi:NADP-dependent 3-hydroxy acid dehydrogenase YdfG